MAFNYREIEVLKKFEGITLEDMDQVRLMNRTDTKFVMSRTFFNDLLPQLMDQYRALEINNKRLANYRTLYFDTPIYQFFLDHHNKRGNRFKVRIRNYVDSDLFFLEVKNKNKGRTNKQRIKLEGFELDLKPESEKYVKNIVGEKVDLVSKLWNTFDRMTLVNKIAKERLTIDLNLSFEWSGREERLDHLVIAELKQETVNRDSPFYSMMKKNGIRPNRMSKYCVGAIKLNRALKYNNFKERILLIDKLG